MNAAPTFSFKLLGLTGGIASGKSTVARWLKNRGFILVDADIVAREVVAPGTQGLKLIADAFGQSVLAQDGSLDRAALGKVVFGDADARQRLNNIIHPLIAARSAALIQQARDHGEMMIIYEAALIVENQLYKGMDHLIVVSVSPEVQLRRLVQRDDSHPDDAQQRIDSQLPLADKIAVADTVIDNSGSLQTTQQALEEFVQQLPGALWPDQPDAASAAFHQWLDARQQTHTSEDKL